MGCGQRGPVRGGIAVRRLTGNHAHARGAEVDLRPTAGEGGHKEPIVASSRPCMSGVRAVVGKGSGLADRADCQDMTGGSRKLYWAARASCSSNQGHAPLLRHHDTMLDDDATLLAPETQAAEVNAGPDAMIECRSEIAATRRGAEFAYIQLGIRCITADAVVRV